MVQISVSYHLPVRSYGCAIVKCVNFELILDTLALSKDYNIQAMKRAASVRISNVLLHYFIESLT